MDLLEILRGDIEALPDGPHLAGLRSVVRHIDAAQRHLQRGQEQKDETAFTDAIYRTNQAFEGSIKEAYRVLAGKQLGNVSIYTIENYLEKKNTFRNRVLSQFKNYRTEWRNPSTHDYNLDFDDDEALLAIVSVSAFAKLLIDQISEQLAFLATKADLAANPPSEIVTHAEDLTGEVAAYLVEFSQRFAPGRMTPSAIDTESQLIGSLAAFLGSVAPHLKVVVEPLVPVGGGRGRRADMVVSDQNNKIVMDIRQQYRHALLEQWIEQMKSYVPLTGAAGGILFFSRHEDSSYAVFRRNLEGAPQGIAIVVPAAAKMPNPLPRE